MIFVDLKNGFCRSAILVLLQICCGSGCRYGFREPARIATKHYPIMSKSWKSYEIHGICSNPKLPIMGSMVISDREQCTDLSAIWALEWIETHAKRPGSCRIGIKSYPNHENRMNFMESDRSLYFLPDPPKGTPPTGPLEQFPAV